MTIANASASSVHAGTVVFVAGTYGVNSKVVLAGGTYTSFTCLCGL